MITRVVNRCFDPAGCAFAANAGGGASPACNVDAGIAAAVPSLDDGVPTASRSPTLAVAVIIPILPNGQFH